MKFFSLGSWLDDFLKNIDCANGNSTNKDYTKINTIKSLASSLYDFHIEDADLAEIENKGDNITVQDLEDAVLKNINIYEFFFNSIKDFSEIYLNNDIIDLNSKENLDFFYKMTGEIIANVAIMAYISEKYQNECKSHLTLRELYNKRDNVKKTPVDYTYYSNKCNYMCFNTILGQLLEVDVKYKKDGRIDRYLFPEYQSGLLGNIVSSIKLSNFNKFNDDSLMFTITDEKKKEYKTFTPSDKFIEYLFYGFKGNDNSIDNIVTLYIIERIFNFNLIFEMTNELNEFKLGVKDFSIEQDIISDIFKSFFKNPIISGRIKYMKSILKYKATYDKRIKITNEILNQYKNYMNISKLFLATDKFGELISWQENVNHYMSYLNLYFIPLIENIFHLYFLKLKTMIGDSDKILRLLETYILNKDCLKMNFDSYREKIYYTYDGMLNEPFANKSDKKGQMVRKREIANQLYKLSNSVFEIDNTISYDHKIQQNVKRSYYNNKEGEKLTNAELSAIKNEINNNDISTKESLITGTISNLLYERSLLKGYTDIKYICQNCNGFSVIDILECIKEHYPSCETAPARKLKCILKCKAKRELKCKLKCKAKRKLNYKAKRCRWLR